MRKQHRTALVCTVSAGKGGRKPESQAISMAETRPETTVLQPRVHTDAQARDTETQMELSLVGVMDQR